MTNREYWLFIFLVFMFGAMAMDHIRSFIYIAPGNATVVDVIFDAVLAIVAGAVARKVPS